MQGSRIKPKSLILYLTKRCNARCPNCIWFLQNEQFFGGSYIKLEDAKEILKYYHSKLKIKNLRLQAEGEALCYPFYKEIVSFARKKIKLVTDLQTNGILLNEYYEFILKNINKISVSIDGPDYSTYIKHRGGNESLFHKITKNVYTLVKKIKRNGKKLPINVNCVITSSDYKKILPMIRYAEKLKVNRIRFINFHPVGGELKPLYATEEIKEYLEQITSETKYKIDIALPGLYNNRPKVSKCSMLFSTILIGDDGNFAPCCREYSSSKYGNWYSNKRDYNSPVLIKFREQFLKARAKSEFPTICQECPRRFSDRAAYSSKKRRWSGLENIA